jgi:hypothetical protein
MTAFAVAAGGAVIVYGSNVITNAKNTQITGILGTNGNQTHLTQEEIDAHFNDSSKQISFSSSELNSRSFANLRSRLQELVEAGEIWDIYNTSITYNGHTFTPDETTFGTAFCYEDFSISTPGYTEFNPEGEVNGDKFNYYTYGENHDILLPFESSLIWNFGNNFYNEIKSALSLDF